MHTRWLIFLPLMGLLSACVTLPSGPTVMVLPAAGKPFDQFQADDLVCRQYAQVQTGVPPGEATKHGAISGGAVGTLLGAGIGAAIGAASGSPDVGAAVGAGSGLLLGTTAGAQSGSESSDMLQWRYDVAYVQCMYAKGNQVPGMAAAAPGRPAPQVPPTYGTPPPPPPPSAPPPPAPPSTKPPSPPPPR